MKSTFGSHLEHWKQQYFLVPKSLKTALVVAACVVLVSASYLHYQKSLAQDPTIAEVLGEGDYDSDENPLEIGSPLVVFGSDLVPIRQKTAVKISFIPPKDFGVIWLSLATQAGHQGINVLFHHSVLQDLQWDVVKNVNYSLYQKEPFYTSIEEFLNNPPREASIAADLYLDELLNAKQIPFVDISEVTDPNPFDYIFTTYHQPYQSGKFTIFETILDTSYGIISDNQLSWSLSGSNIGPENKYWLGPINIDYRQPAP